MAQKRPKQAPKDFKTFNLFTAFSTDGKLKSRVPIYDMESDEEEDLEELKAKLQKSSKGVPSKGKRKAKVEKKRKKKNGQKSYSSSSSGEEDVPVNVLDSPPRPIVVEDAARHEGSPSPPPPPEFTDAMVNEIMRKNQRAASSLRSLENKMRSYKMSKAMAEIDNFISPVAGSPTEIIDISAPVSRNTITVKVRSRQGLLRFEDYQMTQTFEHVCSELGRAQGVPGSRVRLTRKGEDILESDTPRSINLHIADILDYVIVEDSAAFINRSLLDDEDFVIIKLRTNERGGETLKRRIPKMETLRETFEEFGRIKETPLLRLQFLFDGELVDPDSTPEELDMDGENVIDVIVLPQLTPDQGPVV